MIKINVYDKKKRAMKAKVVPAVCERYTHHKHAVDTSTKLLKSLHMHKKERKWTFRVLMDVFALTFCNTLLIYEQQHGIKVRDRREFFTKLAIELAKMEP